MPPSCQTALAAALAAAVLAGPARAQDLYVSDYNSVLSKYTTTGGVLDPATGQIFATSTPANGLNQPTGMAFDAAGDLFVANSQGGDITEFKNVGGALSPTGQVFATVTFFGTPIHGLTALAFDASGDLFVANPAGAGITEFVSSGGTLSTTQQTFANPVLSGHSASHGLAFDAAGDLFVADGTATASYNGDISEYKSSGGVLSHTPQTFATATAANGLDDPSDLAFDASGDLFVTNFNGGSLSEFTSSGGSLSPTGQVFATDFNADLNGPTDLAFDAAGDLFVGYYALGGGITEFTSSGGTLLPTGQPFDVFNGLNSLSSPIGLAFSPRVAVPEPASAALVGLGLLPLGLAAKKRLSRRA